MAKKKKYETIQEYPVGRENHPQFGNLLTSYILAVRDVENPTRKNRHVVLQRVECISTRSGMKEVHRDGWVPAAVLDPKLLFAALRDIQEENSSPIEARPSLRKGLEHRAAAAGVTLNLSKAPRPAKDERRTRPHRRAPIPQGLTFDLVLDRTMEKLKSHF